MAEMANTLYLMHSVLVIGGCSQEQFVEKASESKSGLNRVPFSISSAVYFDYGLGSGMLINGLFGKRKALICIVCQFFWAKNSHHSQFQATKSLTISSRSSWIFNSSHGLVQVGFSTLVCKRVSSNLDAIYLTYIKHLFNLFYFRRKASPPSL